jgi:DNA-binding CsgD family transcriptional regulator
VSVQRLPSSDKLLGLGVQAVAWIRITDPANNSLDPADTLRRRYGLTAAETRLVIALAKGDAPKQAAMRFHVSEHTIRSQLKSALGKTGTHRQT